MRIGSVLTHSAQAVTKSALVALLVVGLMAGTTFAAKGGGGGGHKGGGSTGGGSIAVVMVADANANGLPNWADQITFTVSTTATSYPYVQLSCSQGGVLVYSASAGFFPSYPWPWTQNFTLSSNSWTGGAASCKATLYSVDGGSETILTTLSFNVYS